jgi:toxin YoeB
MRSLVSEGNTWIACEELRLKDNKLHKVLCRLFKDMLRADPSTGTGKPEPLKLTSRDYGLAVLATKIVLYHSA